jgi:hypothetical protein
MGAEANIRKKLCAEFVDLDFRPCENRVEKGTPDCHYIDGWVELKQLDEWPARDTTIVRFHRYTNNQRIWLTRRWKKGGRSFLLLRVKTDWLMFAGADAWPLGMVCRRELEQLALISTTSYDPQSIRTVLLNSVVQHNANRDFLCIPQHVSRLLSRCSSGVEQWVTTNGKPPSSSK